MILRFCLCLLAVGWFTAAAAQKVIINGQEGNRPLQWSDFTGAPDGNSPYFANTYWDTRYQYSGVRFNGEAALIEGFEFTLQLVPKDTWVKEGKQTDALLKHEQGHFNTGLLYQKEALQKMASASFTRNGYKTEIRELFAALYEEYNQMNKRYDEETAHGINKEEQKKWEAFFAKELK